MHWRRPSLPGEDISEVSFGGVSYHGEVYVNIPASEERLGQTWWYGIRVVDREWVNLKVKTLVYCLGNAEVMGLGVVQLQRRRSCQ